LPQSPTFNSPPLSDSEAKKSSKQSISKRALFRLAAGSRPIVRDRTRIVICSQHSTLQIAVIAVVIFVAAHLALMIGLTTPDKIIFDEVHYVPAAKQMLEPGIANPIGRRQNFHIKS
jgi:dolichyl-phosphate-mannose-protein mannosyltransferase